MQQSTNLISREDLLINPPTKLQILALIIAELQTIKPM